jgi:hypothetical protein
VLFLEISVQSGLEISRWKSSWTGSVVGVQILLIENNPAKHDAFILSSAELYRASDQAVSNELRALQGFSRCNSVVHTKPKLDPVITKMKPLTMLWLSQHDSRGVIVAQGCSNPDFCHIVH